MDPSFLAPTRFIDSDHPDVIAFAKKATEGATTNEERAKRLFLAVREGLRYDPYTLSIDPDSFKASHVLTQKAAYCIPKSVLLAAAARAVGIPARLGFADVKNHLSSEKLLRVLGTDVFAWHGYVELWIDGEPVKVTPAFNASLCARFNVPPLELERRDGRLQEAMLQAFDSEGHRYMEYLRDRGLYTDLPLDEIFATFSSLYGVTKGLLADRDEAFH